MSWEEYCHFVYCRKISFGRNQPVLNKHRVFGNNVLNHRSGELYDRSGKIFQANLDRNYGPILLSEAVNGNARGTTLMLPFPSHATIFTLSTLMSCMSRNSTSFSRNVQTLSQKRYVWSLPALKFNLDFTRFANAVFMALSN
ncbi:unnamed protein product [Allacma fusca]|uniref:Uncharacterized protein n=1 Tax=Allacma fusca TaxID=39272 RepID=A0A8J2KZ77_9HEXA|nr:unnamed protein product [Allacma fusca]